MPHPNTPRVRRGQLVTVAGDVLRLDTPAWFAWLHTVSSFSYSSSQSSWRLTVRRDKRRRQTYWYGYAKNDGKLYNVYLGKTEQLTQANLEAACERLRKKVRLERRWE